MAKFVKKVSDVAMALNRIQGFAENFISTQTNRRIQLGREKEARMVDAYRYMLGEEESQIAELESALDAIETNFLDRGIELKSVKPELRTIASEEILNAANEGAMEMVQVRLDDSRDYKSRLENKKREASKILRHINLFDDALSLIDPAYAGDKKLIEADDVAVVYDKLIAGMDEELTQELKDTEAYLKQRTEYLQRPEGLEAIRETYKADHLASIQGLEVPRKHTLDVLKMQTQDPAMVLGSQFSSLGVLEQQLADETVPSKKTVLKGEIQDELASIGGNLFPQIMDTEGNWASPTPETAAKMAQDLRTSLLLLTREGDPTQFVAYLEHVQLYYDRAKKDSSEQGRAVSNRIRKETLGLLGIDLEAPVQFGEETMSQIELILLQYKELEDIELEQLFSSMQIKGSAPSNVSFGALESDSTASKADIFGKAKLRK